MNKMKYSNYVFQDFNQGEISERWREKLKSHQDILKTSISLSSDIDHPTEQIDSTLHAQPDLSLLSSFTSGSSGFPLILTDRVGTTRLPIPMWSEFDG